MFAAPAMGRRHLLLPAIGAAVAHAAAMDRMMSSVDGLRFRREES